MIYGFIEYFILHHKYLFYYDDISPEIDTVITSGHGVTNVNGIIKVFNTINEFNLLDKNKLLEEIGQEV